MVLPRVGIVSPARPGSNTGNARTAERWARLLAGKARVTVLTAYRGEPLELLIALHARRSAEAVAAWAGRGPAIVVLTGTDLYRDIAIDAQAQRSLELADALIVLQEQGVAALPRSLRRKARVVYQSSPARQALPRTARHLRAVMVGHLRDEKDPRTFFEAARRLRDRDDILLDLVGGSLDPALAREARATARACPRFRWLGPQEHEATLKRIARAHLLVSCSRMEGGAHVVLEAVRARTPVLASRIDGNLGMLGKGYRGYFAPGDAGALAQLLVHCREQPRILSRLAAQCRARDPRFEPARERQLLVQLIHSLLQSTTEQPR